MARVLYKPLGVIASVVGGLLASSVFRWVWKAVAHQDEAPRATDRRRRWGEVVVAAGVQGAIFGLVKALVDRAGATGFARMTGAWPGSE